MEDVAVTVTHGGYLKRTAVDTYRRQSRGGKGRIGMGTRSEDFVEYFLVASTHSYLLIFTDRGQVFWLKIYEIPDAATIGKGKHLSNLVNLQPGETVKGFLAVREFQPGKFIVMVTKNGVIKKCELTEFDNPMARGISGAHARRRRRVDRRRPDQWRQLHLPRLARGPSHPLQ